MTRTRWLLIGILSGLALATALAFPGPRHAIAQGVLTFVVEKPGNPAPTHVILNGNRGFNNAVGADRECDKTAQFTTLGTTATVQQIAAVPGQSIYVCGWLLFGSTAVAAVNLSWSEGTGANCVTGATTIGQFLTTPTAAPTTPNSVYGPSNPALKFTTTAGDALCITQSSVANATTVTGFIFYTQGS